MDARDELGYASGRWKRCAYESKVKETIDELKERERGKSRGQKDGLDRGRVVSVMVHIVVLMQKACMRASGVVRLY